MICGAVLLHPKKVSRGPEVYGQPSPCVFAIKSAKKVSNDKLGTSEVICNLSSVALCCQLELKVTCSKYTAYWQLSDWKYLFQIM